jgi:glyoxylate carboligase
MFHHRDTWAQYQETLYECFQSAEEDKQDLERMSALRSEGDIEDYINQKTYYNTNLGPKGLGRVSQIDLGILSRFKDRWSMKLGRTYDEEDYEEAITVVGLRHEERQREIEHEMKLDKARSKNDIGK